jgi:hypothetical protein
MVADVAGNCEEKGFRAAVFLRQTLFVYGLGYST